MHNFYSFQIGVEVYFSFLIFPFPDAEWRKFHFSSGENDVFYQDNSLPHTKTPCLS